MVIKNKNGTPFTLRGPNPIMKEQSLWDDFLLHNMNFPEDVIINNNKEISPDNVKLGIDTLYKKKLEDWVKSQSEVGGNIKPGEGTRRKLEKDSETELFKLLNADNVKVGTTEPDTEIKNNETPLQESIKRMKTLIFF